MQGVDQYSIFWPAYLRVATIPEWVSIDRERRGLLLRAAGKDWFMVGRPVEHWRLYEDLPAVWWSQAADRVTARHFGS